MRFALALVGLAAFASAQTQQLPLPNFGNTFSSTAATRGFYFQTPVPITIVGLRVPDETANGTQNVEVFNLGAAPPAFPGTASGGQVFVATNVTSNTVLQCNLNFPAGAWIGVLGACGTTSMANSYATPTGPFNTTIAGQPVTLTRFLTQTNLNTTGGNQLYSSEAGGNIARVEIYYNTPELDGQVGIPAFSSTFSGSASTRGFYFQTPVPIIVTGLRVPDEAHANVQNVSLTRMASAPPAFPGTANGGQVFYAANRPSHEIIPCNIPFMAGDWVGVLGACGTGTMYNSYSGTVGTYSSSIAGIPVSLTRFLTQTNLNAGGNQPYSSELGGIVCRVEIYYIAATGHATATNYGIGCNNLSRSFYEYFSSASSFDLGGNSMRLVPAAGRYNVLNIGTYVAPTGAATSLVLSDDSQTTVSLPSAFPYPGGSTSALTVCSNGFVSVATGNGTAFSPTASSWLNSPAMRWGSWHDYNPGSIGSGAVKAEHVGNVTYITWDGVYDFAGPTPNTWQLQFDRSTGTVTYVWQTISGSGNAHLVGFGAGNGASHDNGSMDLSVQLPFGFSTSTVDQAPLQHDASAGPTIGTSIQLTSSNITAGSPFGVNLLGFGQINPGASLGGLGAPGCFQYVNATVTNVFLIGGATANTTLNVPSNPFLMGLHVYAQSATFTPGGNSLGILFSNGTDLLIDLL